MGPVGPRALLTPIETWLGEPRARGRRARSSSGATCARSAPRASPTCGRGRGSPACARCSTACAPSSSVYTDERGRELFDVPNLPLPDADTPAPPRLLPDFDNALLGHDDRSRIVGDLPQRLRVEAEPRHVLVDGFLAGTWRFEGRGAKRTVKLDLAVRLDARDRRALDEEVDRFTAFASGYAMPQRGSERASTRRPASPLRR